MFSLIRHYQRYGRINACFRNEYTNKFVIPKIKFLVDEKLTIEILDLSQATIDLVIND
jgi:hypothetical protein